MEQKNLRADLHIHTTASDGTWEPERLIKELKNCCIGLFSITDHDTTENIEKAAVLAEESGIGFIPGVEISVSYNKVCYHMLGFGINPDNPRLQSILNKNRVLMEQKDDDSILYLEAKHGCVSFREYREYTNRVSNLKSYPSAPNAMHNLFFISILFLGGFSFCFHQKFSAFRWPTSSK